MWCVPFRIKVSLSSPSPCLPSFYDFFSLRVGGFYLCSHSAQRVPRALLNYAGTEAVRLAVSYCIVKCLSWKQPGLMGRSADRARHTHTLASPRANTHTHTRWQINYVPFTLPRSFTCFIDTEMKLKVWGAQGDAALQGRVTYLRPSTLQHTGHIILS